MIVVPIVISLTKAYSLKAVQLVWAAPLYSEIRRFGMQSAQRQLTARERTILHQIVGAHIESGEPVGSRTLARLRHLSLSPATIRNVMADLADDGYLAQPHASAGRVPTDKAFRDFAASVPARPLPPAERQR